MFEGFLRHLELRKIWMVGRERGKGEQTENQGESRDQGGTLVRTLLDLSDVSEHRLLRAPILKSRSGGLSFEKS
jgi:hypothetical protein